MDESSLHDDVCLISKGLYRIVSDSVGPECIVKLRRQGWNIRDDFINCDSNEEETTVTSGSRGEGFNFQSSDFDLMYIHRKAIVLTPPVLITTKYDNVPTILLMETDNVSPGFAFIRSIRCDQNNETLRKALIRRDNGEYVSSKQVRDSYMSTKSTVGNGPCQTVSFLGEEGDNAFTLRCPVWPKQAMSFVRRSLHHGWPSHDTLAQICMDGCLLVPKNSKRSNYSDMKELQWRISFSLAEKKLINSMDHYQFLCYGLFKIFLKEILKKDDNAGDLLRSNFKKTAVGNLLCSYFLKTAVFWEVQENPNDWSHFNFLSKFQNVFRRILEWVNIGYCPNFFIPENNMFSENIYGENRRALFRKLRDLYKNKFMSLLLCPSLNENLSKLIRQPDLANTLSIEEFKYVPKQTIVKQRLRAVLQFDTFFSTETVENIMRILINTLLIENTEMICEQRLRVKHILQAYAQSLILSKKPRNLGITRSRMNYIYYKIQSKAKRILLKAKTYFCMDYFILIKHLFCTGNYHKTIDMIYFTIRKLKSRPYMYKWNLDADIIMSALQQGMSDDAVVNSFIMRSMSMNVHTALDELKDECSTVAKTYGGSGLLFIPPLVYLDFLLILCYTKLDEKKRRDAILCDILILFYNGYHVHECYRAISWEILGICWQLFGDRDNARKSYNNALYESDNYFKKATLKRIKSLETQVKCAKMDSMITRLQYCVL